MKSGLSSIFDLSILFSVLAVSGLASAQTGIGVVDPISPPALRCYATETVSTTPTSPAKATSIGNEVALVDSNTTTAHVEFDGTVQSGTVYHIAADYVLATPPTLEINVTEPTTKVKYVSVVREKDAQFQIYNDKKNSIVMILCHGI